MNGLARTYNEALARLTELQPRLQPVPPAFLSFSRLLIIAVIVAAYLIDRQLLPSVVTYLVSYDNPAWAGIAVNVIPAAIILIELWLSLGSEIEARTRHAGTANVGSLYGPRLARLQLPPEARWNIMKFLILLVQPAAAYAMYRAIDQLSPAAHESNVSLFVFMISIALVSHLVVLTSGVHLLALLTAAEQRILRTGVRRAGNALLDAERGVLFHYRNLRALIEEHNRAFPDRQVQADLDPRTADAIKHILNGDKTDHSDGPPDPPSGPPSAAALATEQAAQARMKDPANPYQQYPDDPLPEESVL